MGRTLRKVPANWEHPKKQDGTYQPMIDKFYLDVFNEWLENHKKWMDGAHKDLQDDPNLKEKYPFYALWVGDPPLVEYYHSKKYSPEELTHIQLYETTTEGTPLSPVFHSSELDKLCEWAEKNATTFATLKASKEQWKEMLLDDFVYHQSGNVIFI